MAEKKAGKKSRLVLPALVLVFVAPLLISWWLVNFTDYGRSMAGGNHGDLIVPPRPLQNLQLQDLLGEQSRQLHGKWNLVFLQQGPCEKDCFDSMYKMRQIRLATGKYAQRIQRLMLTDGPFESPLRGELKNQFKGQLILDISDQKASLIESFNSGADKEPMQNKAFYIIDPLGNLMMRYPANTDPTGIIKDLKRLLRYSRIG